MNADGLTSLAAAHRLAAAQHGSRPAIALGERVILDHAGLADRAARIASALVDRGLEPGDRVALILDTCVDFYPLLLGIWTAGLSAVPILPTLGVDEHAWLLAHSGAKLALVEARLRPPSSAVDSITRDELASLWACAPLATPRSDPRGLEAPAWLFYTSGTTGRPKGVVLSHRNLFALVRGYLEEVDQPEPGDSLLHLTPLTHGSGMAGLPHLVRGANQVIPNTPGLGDLDEVLALIERWPRTALVVPPVAVDALARRAALEPERVTSLRAVLYGSAPMFPSDAARALATFGPKLIQLYGLGEAPMSVLLGREAHLRAVNRADAGPLPVGSPRAGIELRIVDGLGATLPAGTVGEILIRGESVMSGYWNAPASTAATLREGWLHTGDLGWRDRDGDLYVLGRALDTVWTHEGAVHPQAIELELMRDPAVREAAVVASPSAGEEDEEPVAFVVLELGFELDDEALAVRCKGLAPEQRPTTFIRVEALPRNGSGKVLRRQLRDQLRDQLGEQDPNPRPPAVNASDASASARAR